MRRDPAAGYKVSPRTIASRRVATPRWDAIHSTTRSTDDEPAAAEPAAEPAAFEPTPTQRAWVDWVLDSVMAAQPYPYAALLLPASEPPVTALRLAGERRDAGIGRPACGASPTDAVALEDTICGSVFVTGTPALVADVREHPGYRLSAETAMRSGLVVPVVRDGRPIGVINVESPRVGGLDIADLERVTRVAEQAAERAPS